MNNYTDKKIIDISLPLSATTIVYPNNVPLQIETHAHMPEATTHLSKITMGTHTGTHVDAPMHAVVNGQTLDQIPLEVFVGLCRVVDASHRGPGESVKKADLGDVVAGERILIKTSNSLRGFNEFYDDYVYLDGDTADWLAEIGVKLVGIDYLSIKQKGSKDQRPHTSLLEKNIPIIEGINLNNVGAGYYELVCLPLKFIGVEGGPVRAILREIK
jgi:arylformamidase